jgi:cytochrome c-type biogenesis protein CcmH
MLQRVVLSLAVIVASFYAVAVVQAQDSFRTDNDVNEIAKKLYCPVCPNTPLDVCETKACQDWRVQIKEQLLDGWSEEQIIEYFTEQYGERVLAEPQRSGFTSLVWILPVVAVLLGVVVAAQALKSWVAGRQSSQAASVSEPQINANTLAQIEKDLRQLD